MGKIKKGERGEREKSEEGDDVEGKRESEHAMLTSPHFQHAHTHTHTQIPPILVRMILLHSPTPSNVFPSTHLQEIETPFEGWTAVRAGALGQTLELGDEEAEHLLLSQGSRR